MLNAALIALWDCRANRAAMGNTRNVISVPQLRRNDLLECIVAQGRSSRGDEAKPL
jgi:hypothetical protein